jgi:RNA polymerase sigma factor (sigma-70 family)
VEPQGERATGELLRELAPQVLGALVRRFGDFDRCEEAVQESLLRAAQRWPVDGLPDRPRAWLIQVASRLVIDRWRSDQARRRRELEAAARSLDPPPGSNDGIEADDPGGADDSLTLLFLCCHPSLSQPSQLALTLRAVGGLTTAEIAAAFLVPESTMAQRISRAKARLRDEHLPFELPAAGELAARLDAVLHVLYLIFNEGYSTSAGDELVRTDLTAEAIRLTRQLHRQLPDEGEVTGLLALMLLTDARSAARTTPEGALVPLAEQDRARWDHTAIAEGVELISHALATTRLGPFQLQAAIAAVHDEAPTAQDTDWPQVLALYGLLEHGLAQRGTPNPIVTLNRAVAVAMVHGPSAGLALLDTVEDDERVGRHHRLLSVRAHLLELEGDVDAARSGYLEAARRTTSLPEQRHLRARAARLA